jgi:hypothetical protein
MIGRGLQASLPQRDGGGGPRGRTGPVAPIMRTALSREDEWLGVVVDDRLRSQTDAYGVHRARHAAMPVADEPNRAADLACGSQSFERDKRAAVVHHPLREDHLVRATRERAARAEVVKRAVAGDRRVQYTVQKMRSSLLRQ